MFLLLCLDIKIFLGDDEEEEDNDDDQIEEMATEENQPDNVLGNNRSSSVTGKYNNMDGPGNKGNNLASGFANASNSNI